MSEKPHELKPGNQAPEFTLSAEDGSDVSLADFRGTRVLLYFFPKALTPG
jgi:peroxiredoxin Q/BCP